MRIIEAVGNQQRVQPQPITMIQSQVYPRLQDFWGTVRTECEKRFTPAECQALLGVRPTILAPAREEGIAWYWLVGIGLVIGKVIL